MEILQSLDGGRRLSRASCKLPQRCRKFAHILMLKKFFRDILKELHAAHLGGVNMKDSARSFVSWPRFDKDTEVAAK